MNIILVAVSIALCSITPSRGFAIGDQVKCNLCRPFTGEAVPKDCETDAEYGVQCPLCYQLSGPDHFLREICVPISSYMTIMNTVIHPELELCWMKNQGNCILRLLGPETSSPPTTASLTVSSSSGGNCTDETNTVVGDEIVEDIKVEDNVVEEEGGSQGNDVEDNDVEDDDVEDNDVEDNDVEDNDVEDNDVEDNDVEDNDVEDDDVEDDSIKGDAITPDDAEANDIPETLDDDAGGEEATEEGTSEADAVLFEEIFVLFIDDEDTTEEGTVEE